MKHRLQGDKKTLRLRQGFRLRAYERFAETSRRDRLQAIAGCRGSFLPGFGGALVLQMVFSFSLLQHTVLGIQGDAQSRCEKEPYQPSFGKIRA